MNYIIWRAREVDYDKLVPIFQEVHNLHTTHLKEYFSLLNNPMPKEDYLKLIKDKSIYFLIIGDKKNIFGFSILAFRESGYLNILLKRVYAYICEFAIISIHQKKGYGKALFNECVKIAKEMKAKSLELDVWDFNQNAMAFYKSLGMETLNHRMILKL